MGKTKLFGGLASSCDFCDNGLKNAATIWTLDLQKFASHAPTMKLILICLIVCLLAHEASAAACVPEFKECNPAKNKRCCKDHQCIELTYKLRGQTKSRGKRCVYVKPQ